MEIIWNGGNSSKGRWESIIKRKQLYLEQSKLQTFQNYTILGCILVNSKQLSQISENFRKPLKFQQIGKVGIDCITNVTNPLKMCQIFMVLKLNSNYHSFSHHICLRISSHVLVDQKWVLWFVFFLPNIYFFSSSTSILFWDTTFIQFSV